MKLVAVKTDVIKEGDDIVKVTLESLNRQNLCLKDQDILALSSKILAYSEGCVLDLSGVKPSREAEELAHDSLLQPEMAELVLHEADKIFGGMSGAVLTLTKGILTANAGIDRKNAPPGSVILWTRDAERSVRIFREEIVRRTGKKIAALVVDSGLMPLRLGTCGLALAGAGFKPIADFRGRKDIFGKTVMMTLHAVANNLASAAHLLMSESSERTPLVLIEGAPVEYAEISFGPGDLSIPRSDCIFASVFGTRGS